jgi:hypothetical protein
MPRRVLKVANIRRKWKTATKIVVGATKYTQRKRCRARTVAATAVKSSTSVKAYHWKRMMTSTCPMKAYQRVWLSKKTMKMRKSKGKTMETKILKEIL